MLCTPQAKYVKKNWLHIHHTSEVVDSLDKYIYIYLHLRRHEHINTTMSVSLTYIHTQHPYVCTHFIQNRHKNESILTTSRCDAEHDLEGRAHSQRCSGLEGLCCIASDADQEVVHNFTDRGLHYLPASAQNDGTLQLQFSDDESGQQHFMSIFRFQ